MFAATEGVDSLASHPAHTFTVLWPNRTIVMRVNTLGSVPGAVGRLAERESARLRKARDKVPSRRALASNSAWFGVTSSVAVFPTSPAEDVVFGEVAPGVPGEFVLAVLDGTGAGPPVPGVTR